jgi:diguanylate cyclase (GGDEF)-like protein/PAS domain S-box-containing protein
MEKTVAHLSSLLQEFEFAVPPAEPLPAHSEDEPVTLRIQAARSLFAALRNKHSPTAAHGLRVALGCSSWAVALGLERAVRDELEIAALLHDIGKLGAPDRLLLKPGVLAADEARLMDQFRLSGLDILTDCALSRAILEIIRHSAGWYNGSRPNYPLVAETIPLGARLLAIVDAFDSMTSEQVYRRAMSRERALHELFSHAGTQFDPDLVKLFSEMQVAVESPLMTAGYWLQTLDPRPATRAGRMPNAAQLAEASAPEFLFQQKLLDNMYDAVIFVDCNMNIIQWNRGAERLTGIAASSVLHRTWSPSLIGMRDQQTGALNNIECPVAYCVNTGVQSLRRLLVANRNNRPIAVDVHTMPIISQDGTTHGATMLLHDASPEASLEERCQNLHERATKDPLTQVANRAEFDRTHLLFINAHLERQLPCSLIICDIDHFKCVNDTYGHQAGDEVLRFFGHFLASECRPGDLVARYGGEEFVMLCADCSNAAAARRAEQMRKTISELSHAVLQQNVVTVSFGVTEIQPGDSPDSMLRRADRALFEAKRMGRNLVVQLGDGLGDFVDAPARDASSALPGGELFIEKVLVSSVPLKLAIEKLRGFVQDHKAEILSIKADRVDLQIAAERDCPGRRRSDRPIPFVVEMSFSEHRVLAAAVEGREPAKIARTSVNVAVRLKRTRDRRNADALQQAASIVASIKSYLMATDAVEPAKNGSTSRAANLSSLWFKSGK